MNIMLKSTSNKSRGFSLLELVIVIVIMVIVIVSLMQVFVYCSRLAMAARNISIATNEAQGKIEDLRNGIFSSVCASDGTSEALTDLDGFVFVYVISPDPCLPGNFQRASTIIHLNFLIIKSTRVLDQNGLNYKLIFFNLAG